MFPMSSLIMVHIIVPDGVKNPPTPASFQPGSMHGFRVLLYQKGSYKLHGAKS